MSQTAYQGDLRNTQISMPSVVILYHQYCHDGYASALIAYDYYLRHGDNAMTPDVYFVGVNPNQLPQIIDQLIAKFPCPEQVRIESFDVGFTRVSFQRLKSAFTLAMVFDHHKSTLDEFAEDQCLPEGLFFDMNQSGAMLAFDYYYPTKTPPMLIQYIQDRDLWTYQLPDSRLVNKALYEELKWDYHPVGTSIAHLCVIRPEDKLPNFDKWLKHLHHPPDDSAGWVADLKGRGQRLTHMAEVMSELMLNGVVSLDDPEGHRVGVCQATFNISELGETLYTQTHPDGSFRYDYVMLWRYSLDKAKILVSLRSRQFDVSRIAKMFGGGGHALASGFEAPIDVWLTWLGRM